MIEKLFVFLSLKENIKKFQEEAEKLEKSSAFKTAKRQFGVFGVAKVF